MTGLIESCWRMIEFLMPTDTKIFRERWPSRLVATAEEDGLSFRRATCVGPPSGEDENGR